MPVLSALAECQCRFPVSGEGVQALFCAEAVAPEQWLRGKVGDRYCTTHRKLSFGERHLPEVKAFFPRVPTRARFAGVR